MAEFPIITVHLLQGQKLERERGEWTEWTCLWKSNFIHIPCKNQFIVNLNPFRKYLYEKKSYAGWWHTKEEGWAKDDTDGSIKDRSEGLQPIYWFGLG